jgi:predicted transcriptional regulator
MANSKKAAVSGPEEVVAKSVRLTEALNLRLAIFAAKTRATHQSIIVTALEDYLKKHDVS